MKASKLTRFILIAMGLGIGFGLFVNLLGEIRWESEFMDSTLPAWLAVVFTEGIFRLGGDVFFALLRLLVVPVVFVSLVCGTSALEDIRQLGRVGVKAIGFYLATTAIAITTALLAALLIKPGQGFELTTEVEFVGREAPSLIEVLVGMFPTNPVQALAEGNMLQIIVFSILFGVAMVLAGEPGKRVQSLFTDLNQIVMRLVTLVMFVAPVGVFCLIARTFATEGLRATGPLLLYFLLVLGVLIVHGLATYSILLRILSGLSPVQFLRKMRTAQLFAFSTASSNATIPVTLDTTENKMGVDNAVASFTVPLGATINMDGTAIMQGVATVFIAQAFGVDLSMGQLLMVVLTATLASIGTAGVPGVGLIMLTMVLTQVGLPVEGVALILGVDRLLDMVRTAVNITGDAAATCIIGKSEGRLDEDVFRARD